MLKLQPRMAEPPQAGHLRLLLDRLTLDHGTVFPYKLPFGAAVPRKHILPLAIIASARLVSNEIWQYGTRRQSGSITHSQRTPSFVVCLSRNDAVGS